VIETAQDYYPFGSLMPGRKYNAGEYRFGFNGQEKDDEITGVTGSHTTAMFWEYDTRLGRRWNLDPKPQIFSSDYSCFANNPILYNDPLGDTIRQEGFKQKFLVKMFQKGLQTNKKDNPFFFNDNGDLSFNQDKYDQLNNDQKAAADNIVGAIKSPIVTTIIKKNINDDIPGGYNTATGATRYFKLWQFGGAAIAPNKNDMSGNSGVSFYWTGKSNVFVDVIKDGRIVSGREPKYIIPFHEIGGHSYYKYTLSDPAQNFLTIKYENVVRAIHGLSPRTIDVGHKGPKPTITRMSPKTITKIEN
jgi:RHS repeat-associated protein